MSENGLRIVTERDVYYAWVDYLYMIVEIENVLHNDMRIRYEPFTDIETNDHIILTRIKVQQLTMTHDRLVTGYLRQVFGEALQTLWAVTIGLLEQVDLDARWMRQAIDFAVGTEHANWVTHIAGAIQEQLQRNNILSNTDDSSVETEFGSVCDVIEIEDCRVMRELKLAVSEGIMVLEQAGLPQRDNEFNQLLGIIQALPRILEGYYERFYENYIGLESLTS